MLRVNEAPDAAVRIPENVISEAFEDEVVLLNLNTGFYFSLTGTGAKIWELLGRSEDLTAIRAAILADYAVEPDSLDEDLRQLVAQLTEHGLVRRETSAP